MKSTEVQTLAQFDWNVACIKWTDWYETELYQTNVKSQGFIYRALFQHSLHWLMYVYI